MKAILLLFTSLISLSSYAQMFSSYSVPFNPDRMQALGLGYDALDKTDRGIECIERNVIDLDSTNDLGSMFSSVLATSHQELLNKMDITSDMSIDMTFAELFSAEASFSSHFNEYFKMRKDELSYVIYLSQDYGRKANINPVIKPQYKALLDAGMYDEFRSICGTHYYSMVQRKSMVVAQIKISGLSEEAKKTLDMKFSSSIEVDFIDVEAGMSASYNSFFKEVNKLAKVSIEFYSIGGLGVRKVSDLISQTSSFDIKHIVDSLSNYTQSLSEQTSAPVKFRMNLYPGYPIQSTQFSLSEKHKLYELVNSTDRNLKLIDSLKEDGHTISDSYSNYYINYLYSQIEKNEEMLTRCLSTGDCRLAMPKKLAVITREDSFRDYSLTTDCSYIPFNGEQYIDRVRVKLKGNLYFPERVKNIEIYMNDNENNLVQTASPQYRQFGKLVHEDFYEATAWFKPVTSYLRTFYFKSNPTGTPQELREIRKTLRSLQKSKFWMKLYVDNSSVLIDLGSPILDKCQATKVK